MKPRILYTKPSITEREVELATDAARNGWGERCYEYIDKFEEAFCKYTGAKYAIATSSCTGALHMGLAALGIGPGDEVIIADTNWVASVAPVTYLGATPVLIDILPDTWCIDPEQVKNAITSNTKAIIAVHLYGNLCDMDSLLEISKSHGIPVIEDSAEAIGSKWKGQQAGTIGKFGVFSFHGTKTVTTGEGGMFVTNDENLYSKVLMLSNHGRSQDQVKQFWPDEIGFKYKMSNIQAAIGCAQLERVDDIVNRKRDIFFYYKEKMTNYNGVTLNPEKEGTINSYWMPTLVFDEALGVSRELLLDEFAKENIDARVFFWPLSGMEMFESKYENPVSWSIPARAINIPGFFDITKSEQDRVISVVDKILS